MLHQLIGYIDSYLIKRFSLRDLEAWLVASLQRILDSGDSAAIELANLLDADLVELSEHLIDELEFRERLEAYVSGRQTLSPQIALSPQIGSELSVTNVAASDAETLKKRMEVPGQVVVHHLEHAFV